MRIAGRLLPASISLISENEFRSAAISHPKQSSKRSTKPNHYQRLDPQPITVIEAWGLSFSLGSALKYIARAGHKEDELRDLRKAIWFLQRQLAVRTAELAGQPAPLPEDQV